MHDAYGGGIGNVVWYNVGVKKGWWNWLLIA